MTQAVELTVTGESPRWEWSSKIGGHAYLVDAQHHPLDSIGNPLAFIAQLNFGDLPHLPGYPTQGLLQFFISTSTARDEHRVIYHATVPTERIRPELPLPARVRSPRPLRPDGWPSPWPDDEFNPIVEPNNELALTGQEIKLRPQTRGHRLGGTPYFNQDGKMPEGHVLLFQLDSEPHQYSPSGYRILWGDLGTGRFSIAPRDLAREVFSRTEYNWDNA